MTTKPDSWEKVDGQWVKRGYEVEEARPAEMTQHIDRIAAQLTGSYYEIGTAGGVEDVVRIWLQFRTEVAKALDAEGGSHV